MATLQRRMVRSDIIDSPCIKSSQVRDQLSQDEEATLAGTDSEVSREDQDKINKFSRLHRQDELLQEKLKTKTVRQCVGMSTCYAY